MISEQYKASVRRHVESIWSGAINVLHMENGSLIEHSPEQNNVGRSSSWDIPASQHDDAIGMCSFTKKRCLLMRESDQVCLSWVPTPQPTFAWPKYWRCSRLPPT